MQEPYCVHLSKFVDVLKTMLACSFAMTRALPVKDRILQLRTNLNAEARSSILKSSVKEYELGYSSMEQVKITNEQSQEHLYVSLERLSGVHGQRKLKVNFGWMVCNAALVGECGAVAKVVMDMLCRSDVGRVGCVGNSKIQIEKEKEEKEEQ